MIKRVQRKTKDAESGTYPLTRHHCWHFLIPAELAQSFPLMFPPCKHDSEILLTFTLRDQNNLQSDDLFGVCCCLDSLREYKNQIISERLEWNYFRENLQHHQKNTKLYTFIDTHPLCKVLNFAIKIVAFLPLVVSGCMHSCLT